MEDRSSLRVWLPIVIAMISLAAFSSGHNATVATEKKGASGSVEKRTGKLKREEELILRNHVYLDGSVVCSVGKWEEDASGQLNLFLSGLKVLHVPERVVNIHKANRVATLKLLLDIVRGGNPRDVHRAVAVAVALEEGPERAEPYAYSKEKIVDDIQEGETESSRDRSIGQIQVYLSTAL